MRVCSYMYSCRIYSRMKWEQWKQGRSDPTELEYSLYQVDVQPTTSVLTLSMSDDMQRP